MSEEIILQSIRCGEYEKAKAHLKAMEHTYWKDEEYDKVAPLIEDFLGKLDELIL